MAVHVANSLSDVSAAEWNSLGLNGSPFLRHEFLFALETQRCADTRSGWRASHILVRDDVSSELIGAIPLYLKKHSWGEFVFDWSWASAFAQHGLDYYPKLTCAIPFTPASGPRLLTKAGYEAAGTRVSLAKALQALAQELEVSSAHVLFPSDEDLAVLKATGFLVRSDCQFHWRNRNYASFDEFIATFRAEKRKKALRERRRVREAGIRFETLAGAEISDDLWNRAFALSESTFAQHGHEHYLTAGFFKTVARALPESVVAICALFGEQLVGVAICFRGDTTLYGRYWGQAANFHSLHFETCYFQGIEYCIRHGLQSFEPGTQGEHKIARGFEPTLTHSAHWIADDRFSKALSAHLASERIAVEQYRDAVSEHLPFHRSDDRTS
jgi:predicted N-acyltransferase